MKNRFLSEENEYIIILSFFSSLIIIFYLLFGEELELVPVYSKVFTLFYGLSLAVMVGVVFYYFQTFLPMVRLRKIADRDVNLLTYRVLHRLFIFLFSTVASLELMSKKRSREDIYSDEYAELISKNAKLDDMPPNQKHTWFEEISNTVNKFDSEYEKIRMRNYYTAIRPDILNSLEQIHRNPIFIEFREGFASKNGNINKISLKKIFKHMKVLREYSRK